MTDLAPPTPVLPPGVHPLSRNSPEVPIIPPAKSGSGAPATGRVPFSMPNGQAMGVFERRSQTWTGRAVRLQSATTARRIVGRRRGRQALVVWVPSSVVIGGVLVNVANGLLLAPTEGEAEQGSGIVLNVGDSHTFYTEAPVYAITLPTKTSGIVQFVDYFNPSSGRSPGT